jgi:hypothetical protein
MLFPSRVPVAAHAALAPHGETIVAEFDQASEVAHISMSAAATATVAAAVGTDVPPSKACIPGT